jgi:hypothetical protein
LIQEAIMTSTAALTVCELKVDLQIQNYFKLYKKIGYSTFYPYTFRMFNPYQAVLISKKLNPPAPLTKNDELHLINLLIELKFEADFVFVNIGSRTCDFFEFRPTFDLNAQIHMPGIQTTIYRDNCSRVQLKCNRSWFVHCMMAYIGPNGSATLPVYLQIKNFMPKNSVTSDEYTNLLSDDGPTDPKYDWKLKKTACSVFIISDPKLFVKSKDGNKAAQEKNVQTKKRKLPLENTLDDVEVITIDSDSDDDEEIKKDVKLRSKCNVVLERYHGK